MKLWTELCLNHKFTHFQISISKKLRENIRQFLKQKKKLKHLQSMNMLNVVTRIHKNCNIEGQC